MYKHIINLTDDLTSIMRFLPTSLAITLYLKIIKILYFYETKLFNHYIKTLLKTKNYYFTLRLINSNNWCPDNLSASFIKYVQEYHENLIHAW
jgi:hypothetical protein